MVWKEIALILGIITVAGIASVLFSYMNCMNSPADKSVCVSNGISGATGWFVGEITFPFNVIALFAKFPIPFIAAILVIVAVWFFFVRQNNP